MLTGKWYKRVQMRKLVDGGIEERFEILNDPNRTSCIECYTGQV